MKNKGKRIAICVAGWHYNEDFYAQISGIPQSEVFVVSHKGRNAVPHYLFGYVDPTHVFFEPNLGYDWGCYQQFLSKNVWREFEYLFFMHDDVIIKDKDFLTPCTKLLNEHAVVGNGKHFDPRRDIPNYLPDSYAFSSWKPPSRLFQHFGVRGSFFATTRKSLEKLGRFEVFWDPFRLTIRFGNWSTRATCGKWEHLYGKKCFGFLSDKYCESEYLVELVRSGLGESKISPIKLRFIDTFRDICRLYMSVYWGERLVHSRAIALSLMKPFIGAVSGAYIIDERYNK